MEQAPVFPVAAIEPIIRRGFTVRADPARSIHATVVALVTAWVGLVLDRAIALDPLASRAVVTTDILVAPVIDLAELQGGAVREVCEVLNISHDHLPCFDGQILAEGFACVNQISMIHIYIIDLHYYLKLTQKPCQ